MYANVPRLGIMHECSGVYECNLQQRGLCRVLAMSIDPALFQSELDRLKRNPREVLAEAGPRRARCHNHSI